MRHTLDPKSFRHENPIKLLSRIQESGSEMVLKLGRVRTLVRSATEGNQLIEYIRVEVAINAGLNSRRQRSAATRQASSVRQTSAAMLTAMWRCSTESREY